MNSKKKPKLKVLHSNVLASKPSFDSIQVAATRCYCFISHSGRSILRTSMGTYAHLMHTNFTLDYNQNAINHRFNSHVALRLGGCLATPDRCALHARSAFVTCCSTVQAVHNRLFLISLIRSPVRPSSVLSERASNAKCHYIAGFDAREFCTRR